MKAIIVGLLILQIEIVGASVAPSDVVNLARAGVKSDRLVKIAELAGLTADLSNADKDELSKLNIPQESVKKIRMTSSKNDSDVKKEWHKRFAFKVSTSDMKRKIGKSLTVRDIMTLIISLNGSVEYKTESEVLFLADDEDRVALIKALVQDLAIEMIEVELPNRPKIGDFPSTTE